jgi:voltage-gated potassium channel
VPVQRRRRAAGETRDHAGREIIGVRIDTGGIFRTYSPREFRRFGGDTGGLVLLPRLRRSLDNRRLTARRAARVIALSTLVLTVAGGAGAWLIDRKDFDGLGDAMWWAVQTVTTVGYGDVVPEHLAGRLIGGALMLQGIALLTVITASVTATLIEQARQRHQEPDAVLAKLEQIESRLEAIERGMRD